jgi:hypothetical protein
MEEIIRILMRRDGMTREAAVELCFETREEIFQAIQTEEGYDEVEDILMYNLGLEPDYLIYFL